MERIEENNIKEKSKLKLKDKLKGKILRDHVNERILKETWITYIEVRLKIRFRNFEEKP